MKTIQSTCISLGLALGLSAALSATPAEIELRYQREVSVAEGPATVRPEAPQLPEELRPAVLEAEPSPSVSDDLETRAGISALLAALDRAEGAGRRESYRLGFHEGLRIAGRDPVVGQWDYAQGIRQGRDSRWARDLGSRLGTGEARRAAEAAAYGHVTAGFVDGAVPARRPRPVAPPYAASTPAVRAPELEDLLQEIPVASALERLPEEDLAGVWERASVAELFRAGDRREIYDGRWADASGALEEWLLDRRNQDSWQRLEAAEQEAFRAAFERYFRSHLAHFFAAAGEAAYRQGFADGWDYGAFVSREWNFRQGFYDGFVGRVRQTAEATFYDRYAAFYAARYRRLVREQPVAGVASDRAAIRDVAPTASDLRGADR